MDGLSINTNQPISPISQLLQNLGMTRDDLTRHSDQMRQFLTTENTNSLRAFSNPESDADSAKSPTVHSQTLRAKSRSVSAADAPPPPPPPPSLPPAPPIKTEPIELPASSSIRRFESMDEIIERQNRRTRRERRSRRERDASPGGPHSPTRSALRASGHPRTTATRETRDSGRAKATDDSLPADIDLSQVSRAILCSLTAVPVLLSSQTQPILRRIYCHNLPRPVGWAAITGTLSSIRPSLQSTVALLVSIYCAKRPLTFLSQGGFVPRAESPSPSRSRRSSVASSIPSESNFLVEAAQKVSRNAIAIVARRTHLTSHISGDILPPSSHSTSQLL